MRKVKQERNQRTMLEVLQGLKLQPVGDGMVDLICPPHHIKSFIDMCDSNDIKIKGFTWWCHVTEGHEPWVWEDLSQYILKVGFQKFQWKILLHFKQTKNMGITYW